MRDRQRRSLNFGNAGALNILLEAADRRMEARLLHLSAGQSAVAQPIAEDFLPLSEGNPESIFADLVSNCLFGPSVLRPWCPYLTG